MVVIRPRRFFQHPVLRVGQVGLIPVEGPIHTEQRRRSIRIQDRTKSIRWARMGQDWGGTGDIGVPGT